MYDAATPYGIVTLRVPEEKLQLSVTFNDYALIFYGRAICLYFNGICVDSAQVSLNLTNMNRYRLNGRTRVNNVNVPVDGTRHRMKHFVIVEGV